MGCVEFERNEGQTEDDLLEWGLGDLTEGPLLSRILWIQELALGGLSIRLFLDEGIFFGSLY